MRSSLELAELVNRNHCGPEREISGVNSIDIASETELAFWERESLRQVESSEFGCVICLPDVSQSISKTCIPSPQPRIDFLKIVNELYRTPPESTEIHPTAVIADGAEIGSRCQIGPNVYVGEKVKIGDRVKIQAGSSIGVRALLLPETMRANYGDRSTKELSRLRMTFT
jgi:UDP-3-O-[3-hydroxymyristoyl] glucosamine N-acyltransferase